MVLIGSGNVNGDSNRRRVVAEAVEVLVALGEELDVAVVLEEWLQCVTKVSCC